MNTRLRDVGDYSYKNRKITQTRIIKYIFRHILCPFYSSESDYYMEKYIRDCEIEEHVNMELDWRVADKNDIPSFKEFLPCFKINLFKKRFFNEEHCLIAICNRKIVHYCWFAYEMDYYVKEMNYLVNVLPDKVYIYDAYTRQDFRDRGIHQEGYRWINRQMAVRGKKYSITMMDLKNLNSIFTALQVGFKLKGSIVYRRILWLEKTRFIPSVQI